jgi:hypothetical protein
MNEFQRKTIAQNNIKNFLLFSIACICALFTIHAKLDTEKRYDNEFIEGYHVGLADAAQNADLIETIFVEDTL